MMIGEIAQILTALTAAASFIASLRNARKIDRADVKIERVENATNGLAAKLVDSARKEAHLQGLTQGLAQATATELASRPPVIVTDLPAKKKIV